MCRRDIRFTAAILLLALATACGDDSTGPDGPTARNDIGEMARDEVEAALDALTLPTSLAPLNVGGPPCAAPSVPTDDDGDGIPNDATYLFTAPPCRYSGVRGSTLDIVGQLRVQDPTAYRLVRLRGQPHRPPLHLQTRRRGRPRLQRHPQRLPLALRHHRRPPARDRSPGDPHLPRPARRHASRSCGPSASPPRPSCRSTSRSPTGL